MAYSQSVYLKAKTQLDKRREKAENDRLSRRSVVLLKVPEIAQLESEMAKCGTAIIRMAVKRQDGSDMIKELAKKSHDIQARRKAALKEAGYSEDYLDAHYFCPVCRDTGYHEGYMCTCYQKLIKETARKELGSAALLDRCTFDTFDLNCYPNTYDSELGVNIREHMSDIYNYCRDWAKDFSKHSTGLIMLGKTGLGKTHLSLAIAQEVTDRGYNVFYSSVQNVMNTLEKQHFGKGTVDEEIEEKLFESDLLILDDLGTEFSTQFTTAQLYNIFNTRLNASLPTVISTNLSMKEIEDKYTQRIASRIIGSSMPLQFVGKDIRQIKSM